MKKIAALILLLSFTAAAQEFRLVRPGVEYAEVSAGTEKEPVHVNLLRLDLTKVRIDVKHAMDAAIGVERTSSLAARYGALAAINAGFFRLDTSLFNGDDVGALMIDEKLLSDSYNDRTSLFIFNGPTRTAIGMDRLKTHGLVAWDGKSGGIRGEPNRERKKDDLVIYTPEFGRSTLTGPDGVEVVVSNDKVISVKTNAGSSLIPQNGFVVSASGSRVDELVNYVRKRKKLYLVTEGLSTQIKAPYEDIVAGVPRLIRDGQVEVTWKEEKAAESFANSRHPRTAVAILKDGRFLMVTVDGRQDGYSVGMTLKELADFLLGIGAVDAMNLDGGGSTTMVLEGKIMNKPSDKEGERRVSDALLVFPR